ncbi:MAG TPA: hypothetical protein VFB42_12715 [Gaiellaceae bacterium]|nr:hypothetical protein [Gaiellaceae bacterium]
MGRGARTAVAAAAVVAVAAPAAGASSSGRQRASGRIAVLRPLTITVHGKHRDLTCRLRRLVPQRLGYAAGVRVEITCDGGVLVRIARGATASSSSSSSSASASASSSGESAFDFVGPVAELSASSIAFGSYSCRIGPGSPGVGAFRRGDRVHAHCTNGVLTSIAAA